MIMRACLFRKHCSLENAQVEAEKVMSQAIVKSDEETEPHGLFNLSLTDAQVHNALSLAMALDNTHTHFYHSQLRSSSFGRGYSENTALSNTSSLKVLSPS
jgi:hypothetical protein